jgi:hypothetical protein
VTVAASAALGLHLVDDLRAACVGDEQLHCFDNATAHPDWFHRDCARSIAGDVAIS